MRAICNVFVHGECEVVGKTQSYVDPVVAALDCAKESGGHGQDDV